MKNRNICNAFKWLDRLRICAHFAHTSFFRLALSFSNSLSSFLIRCPFPQLPMSAEQKTEPAVDCINKSSCQMRLQNVVLHPIQETITRFRTSFVYREITVIICTQNYLYTAVARYCHFRWCEWEGTKASSQRDNNDGAIMSAYKWGLTANSSRGDTVDAKYAHPGYCTTSSPEWRNYNRDFMYNITKIWNLVCLIERIQNRWTNG